ncbi:hypothetical protein G5I_14473 [Acromyrmex echinatior]|uniref:Uncharacterized protein n=1 Tax=Acromyrmex echinatior TaxID=103372 RepID=F4X7T9_ACREC|nr:hypothetical protein G5I_14473 [Acromyrmex echinatior]
MIIRIAMLWCHILLEPPPPNTPSPQASVPPPRGPRCNAKSMADIIKTDMDDVNADKLFEALEIEFEDIMDDVEFENIGNIEERIDVAEYIRNVDEEQFANIRDEVFDEVEVDFENIMNQESSDEEILSDDSGCASAVINSNHIEPRRFLEDAGDVVLEVMENLGDFLGAFEKIRFIAAFTKRSAFNDEFVTKDKRANNYKEQRDISLHRYARMVRATRRRAYPSITRRIPGTTAGGHCRESSI